MCKMLKRRKNKFCFFLVFAVLEPNFSQLLELAKEGDVVRTAPPPTTLPSPRGGKGGSDLPSYPLPKYRRTYQTSLPAPEGLEIPPIYSQGFYTWARGRKGKVEPHSIPQYRVIVE